MRILILGGDGYLGGATAMYLAARGHEVIAYDNYSKRRLEEECGVAPLITPPLMVERAATFQAETGIEIKTRVLDVQHIEASDLEGVDAVIHYAEMPSAPYSMMGKQQCIDTQVNNVAGTLSLIWAAKEHPNCHIIKLGTLGVYGYEGSGPIEEGSNRRSPGSWYHSSKCHDSLNLQLACRLYGLRVTDLHQGVVYGIETDETAIHPALNNSLHYDHVFGTVLNRYICQAVVGVPLTVYGEGGQTRGFLNIRDTMRCLELACLNPPEAGTYEVYNQLTEVFSVGELAERVAKVSGVGIQHIANPRQEKERHHYDVVHTKLTGLGLEPHLLDDQLIDRMLYHVELNADNIDKGQILPTVKWK